MTDVLGPKSSNKFFCKICDYSTCKNSQYERHLSTRKHKQMTLNDDLGPHDVQTYPCICGKHYRYRQGLFNHKKTCTLDEPKNVINPKTDNTSTSNIVDSITDTNTILLLLKQNQEFKQLMIEQHAENMVLQKELINKVNTNTIVNNTTNAMAYPHPFGTRGSILLYILSLLTSMYLQYHASKRKPKAIHKNTDNASHPRFLVLPPGAALYCHT